MEEWIIEIAKYYTEHMNEIMLFFPCVYMPYMAKDTICNHKNYKKRFDLIDNELERIILQKNLPTYNNVEVDDLLLPYFKYLIDNIEPKNLINLYSNLENLKLEKDENLVFKGSTAHYSPYYNKIAYAREKSLGHELLHVASTCKYNELNTQLGFLIYNNKATLGNAINEGYTDYLNEQFFNNHARAYNDVRKIAGYTEELIGKEKMQELYFNNNLMGLFKELQKFMTREEAIKFIALQDSLLDAKVEVNLYYRKPAHEVNKILDKSFKQKSLMK